MRRLIAIASIVAVCSCGGPEEYAPQVVELDILDSLSVVFVDPGFVLEPQRYPIAGVDADGEVLVWWDEWRPMVSNEERGVWVMYRMPRYPHPPVRGNEDINLWPRASDSTAGQSKS